MAIIDKKQKRWYSKSTFDSLDKTTIPVGTEIQVTGEIEEADLTADLQTKINGKLTAPATPTADSVVTMLADGTTGTKKLGEVALAHYYKHGLNFEIPYGLMRIDIITSLDTAYTQPSQFISLINQIPAYVEESSYIGFAVAYGYIQDGTTKFNLVGSGINPASPTESRAIQTIIDATFLSDGVTEL